jgi:GNAT superfamily N-acetyltransferase
VAAFVVPGQDAGMTAPTFAIRPAVRADAAALWPLVREFAVSFTPEREAFERTLPELVARSDTLVLVAEAGGRVIGYLLASVHATFLANAPVAWVEEVMVDAGSRRAGVGSALMAAAERWAAHSGAAYISLASRRAGEFYVSLGYDESAVFFRKHL